MQSVWQCLIWKEYREHVWKFVSCLSILLSVEVVVFMTDDRTPALFETWTQIAMLFGVPWIIFIAMGAAAGERSAGTMGFARSLPVKPWKLAAVKLSVGFATVVVPIFAALLLDAVLVYWFQGGRGFDVVGSLDAGPVQKIVLTVVSTIGIFLVVFLWSTAAGIDQPTEIRAGVAAVVVLVVWFAVTLLGMQTIGPSRLREGIGLAAFPFWLGPVGFMTVQHGDGPPPMFFCCKRAWSVGWSPGRWLATAV